MDFYEKTCLQAMISQNVQMQLYAMESIEKSTGLSLFSSIGSDEDPLAVMRAVEDADDDLLQTVLRYHTDCPLT